ncbi:MAG: ferritin family protein [Candidatus Atribacteria bacterium]|nr:ferritin family protein [Candidatus Atribacteria bacterium]
MSLEEILVQALQMEEDGRNFYLEGSEKVTNPLSKEVLKRLADEELVHIEKIQEGYTKIKNQETFTFEGWGGVRKSSREYFENVFAEAKKHMNELVTPQAGELETIKMAMDLESKSHHFYVEKMKVVTDREMVNFLDFLASEEYRHYNLLFNTHEYLSSPSEWYYKDEKPIFEGG